MSELLTSREADTLPTDEARPPFSEYASHEDPEG
jgi:hypothetical protein